MIEQRKKTTEEYEAQNKVDADNLLLKQFEAAGRRVDGTTRSLAQTIWKNRAKKGTSFKRFYDNRAKKEKDPSKKALYEALAK